MEHRNINAQFAFKNITLEQIGTIFKALAKIGKVILSFIIFFSFLFFFLGGGGKVGPLMGIFSSGINNYVSFFKNQEQFCCYWFKIKHFGFYCPKMERYSVFEQKRSTFVKI